MNKKELRAENPGKVMAPGYTMVVTKDHGMMKTTKDGKVPQPYHAEAKPDRNDACPCGSGKKYKNCCLGGK